MPNYTWPGVYVEEISTLPASIAQVPTAIPAFIGYTEKGEKNVPKRLRSLLEFEAEFGKGYANEQVLVSLDSSGSPTGVTSASSFNLYRSLQLFFANGGGACYVVSAGHYQTTAFNVSFLTAALATVKKVDEPTLLVIPEAVNLAPADTAALQQAMLKQCGDNMDRFAILDVKQTNSGLNADKSSFRGLIGTQNLKYGAAYYPYLKASLPVDTRYGKFSLVGGPAVDSYILDPTAKLKIASADADLTAAKPLYLTPNFPANWTPTLIAVPLDEVQHYVDQLDAMFEALNDTSPAGVFQYTYTNTDLDSLATNSVATGSRFDNAVKFAKSVIATYNSLSPGTALTTANFGTGTVNPALFLPVVTGATELQCIDAARPLFKKAFDEFEAVFANFVSAAETIVSGYETALRAANPKYAALVSKISSAGIIMPPSGAIAGIYAFVDRTQGVWKAPANISLNSVSGLTLAIDDEDQSDMNVDPVGGKSINAIRTFNGRGTLVWGARTLAGNDNEWRYVNVRRLFNLIEESTQKAMQQVVFEGNVAPTWGKVKGSIVNFLTSLWRDGALAGAKPEHAFYVNVGLGTTMTAQDILEGRLIVEIGIAATRPAEFIVLKFMHKLQES